MNMYVLILIFMTFWKCRWEKRGVNTKITMKYLPSWAKVLPDWALAPMALPPLACSVSWQDTAFRPQSPALGGAERDLSSIAPPGRSQQSTKGLWGEAGTFRATQKLTLSYSNCTLNVNLVRCPQTSKIRGQSQWIHIMCIRVQFVPANRGFAFQGFNYLQSTAV